MNKAVIGLEIHIQLLTRSKMFCSCSTSFGDTPNTNICPTCLGYPGTLPELNEASVAMAIKLGLAMQGEINLISDFSRKNYFYPDLPKGYQITQFNTPIVQNGFMEVCGKKIRLNRIHLEEDTAKMFHGSGRDDTLIDFNRAGIPLLEVVTEPDINSAEEADQFLKKLHSIVKFLKISTGKMEEGALRCDVNISLTKEDGSFGPKVEIKNLNSFKSVEKAIHYEIKRQEECNIAQKTIELETRSYDEENDCTFSMRIKPTMTDYRYFLDPDLGQIVISKDTVNQIMRNLQELPEKALIRLMDNFTLSLNDANLIVSDIALLTFFDSCVSLYPQAKMIANWIGSDVMGYLNKNNTTLEQTKLTPKNFISMLRMLESEEISGKMAKNILTKMMDSGKNPEEVIGEQNLTQLSDERKLLLLIDKILMENREEASEYKSGKTNILEMFMGKLMDMTNGTANPGILKNLLIKKLEETS
jgi:aspartyl-tRNA(Asn)/glutamyl-tRNA(Gln) amidotransferase subunit B